MGTDKFRKSAAVKGRGDARLRCAPGRINAMRGPLFARIVEGLARFAQQELPAHENIPGQFCALFTQANFGRFDLLALAVATGPDDCSTRPAIGRNSKDDPASPRSAPGNSVPGVGRQRRQVHRRVCPTLLARRADAGVCRTDVQRAWGGAVVRTSLARWARRRAWRSRRVRAAGNRRRRRW